MSQVGLKVTSHICSADLNDADDIPMESWSEDSKVPCFYFGAWSDEFDFLDPEDWLREEQEQNPARHFFVLNTIPETLEDIKEAIKKWVQR